MKLEKALVRVLATFLLTLCLSMNFVPRPYVYALDNLSNVEYDQEVILAEETEWKYRIVDGRYQKRLWSITYNMWLTDWEWV